MNTKRLSYLLIITSLLCSNVSFGESVSIYCPSDIPAIQFAANDLQKSLKQKGHKIEIAPIIESVPGLGDCHTTVPEPSNFDSNPDL